MLISSLLHFYQPHNQQPDILNRIVNESYLPIIKIMLANPKAKATFNMSGVLIRLLEENNHGEVLQGVKKLLENGQIEFTGSAMYHAFLPLLPESEIERQIMLNDEESTRVFGDLYKPLGFFTPEMAMSDSILKVVSKRGFKWASAPQVAYGSEIPDASFLYKSKKYNIGILFRNKRASALILSAVSRSAEDLLKETQDLQHVDRYWFTVMDAETFGHHRIGHEMLLQDIFKSQRFDTCTASELLSLDLPIKEVELRPSTWTNEEQDFWLDKERKQETLARSFILWQDPENPIHKLQWEFVSVVLERINVTKDESNSRWVKARELMDRAISSDQFWWASAKPWWSLEMIEQGAYSLKEVVFALGESKELEDQAEGYYRKILDQAFEWQRTGYIRKRHLENSATFMKEPFKKRAKTGWYNQMVLEFEDEMTKAAKNRDFEKAVTWRDALIKLKRGTDIYDVLHVVDQLWSARNIPSMKPFLEYDWEEFSAFAKDNLLNVSSKQEFEEWKKTGKPPKEG